MRPRNSDGTWKTPFNPSQVAHAESKVQEQAQELQRLRDENKALRERYEKAHKELCRVRDEQKTIGKIKVNTNF
jgi:predicted nuclease with TOPRIM domain